MALLCAARVRRPSAEGEQLMSKKKKEKRQPPPVLTGHDERAERRSADRREWERESDAPDGVSGNWS